MRCGSNRQQSSNASAFLGGPNPSTATSNQCDCSDAVAAEDSQPAFIHSARNDFISEAKISAQVDLLCPDADNMGVGRAVRREGEARWVLVGMDHAFMPFGLGL
jgi:hypothetical protein